MSAPLYYIVCWLLNNQKLFLLWVDGGKRPDYYVLHEKSMKLLIFQTNEEMASYTEKHKMELVDQPADVIDFNKSNIALTALRPNMPLSLAKAELLLNVWNALDDVSRSTNVQLIPVNLCTQENMDKLYEKLFYGNNLPSVTPEGKKYFPLFDAEERSILRKLFRGAITNLVTLVNIDSKKV